MNPSNSPYISIVVPLFNEAGSLFQVVNDIRLVLGDLAHPFEIILVDDGSCDNSWQEIIKLAQRHPEVKGIRFTRNFGKEAAILAGLRHSKGDAVVIMDADLQHPPALMKTMIKLWQENGVDVVHAVKSLRGNEPFLKKFFARVFYKTMKALAGLDLEGATDFKLLDRKVVDQYLSLPERLRFFRGIVTWFGHRQVQVKFVPGERSAGKTKWNNLSLFRLGFSALFAFTSLPLQIVTILGVFTFITSIVLGIVTMIKKFTGGAAEGFTTIIILILFIGSTLMISLGLIGQYIAMIYEEVKQRPPYVVEQHLKTEDYKR